MSGPGTFENPAHVKRPQYRTWYGEATALGAGVTTGDLFQGIPNRVRDSIHEVVRVWFYSVGAGARPIMDGVEFAFNGHGYYGTSFFDVYRPQIRFEVTNPTGSGVTYSWGFTYEERSPAER